MPIPNQHIFTDSRLEDDQDLVQTVRSLLEPVCNPENLVTFFDNNHYVQEAKNLRPEAQRFILNRYWNLQLLSVNISTIEERYCLISNGEISDWLKLFEKAIVPFAKKHNLPKAL